MQDRSVWSRSLVVLLLAALVGIGCGENDKGSKDTGLPSNSAGDGSPNHNDAAAGASVASGGTDGSSTATGGAGEPADGGGGTPALDAGPDAEGTAPAQDAATNDAEGASDATADADEPGQDSALPSSWPDDKYISPEEVHERLEAGDPDMLLVNVVDEEFYNLGHLPGSLKIPWDNLAQNLDQIDANRHIVIYCRKGVRSESAYETLTSNGYTMVWVMEGGIEAWTAEGYPTVPN